MILISHIALVLYSSNDTRRPRILKYSYAPAQMIVMQFLLSSKETYVPPPTILDMGLTTPRQSIYIKLQWRMRTLVRLASGSP